jgi:heme-degrading monooxygenase HmoA
MFVALWEYEVKRGCEERFEKVYGPEGGWPRLFRSDPDYQETRLLHDAAGGATYVTLDFWNRRKAYEQFMNSHAIEYKRLDAAGGRLTLQERQIGCFETISP